MKYGMFVYDTIIIDIFIILFLFTDVIISFPYVFNWFIL